MGSLAIEPDIQAEIMGATTILEPATDHFRRSDPCSTPAIVGSGSIRVFALSDEGREITRHHVRPGEVCSLTLTCVSGAPRIRGTP